LFFAPRIHTARLDNRQVFPGCLPEFVGVRVQGRAIYSPDFTDNHCCSLGFTNHRFLSRNLLQYGNGKSSFGHCAEGNVSAEQNGSALAGAGRAVFRRAAE
jgi:hypothetical protein